MSTLPPWVTTAQVAEHCGVDPAEMYYHLLQKLEVRRIGVRGGAAPWGRLVRVERGSLTQAATYYQVSAHLIRQVIAHEQLDARRIGSGRAIRIDRDSLLGLGRIHMWTAP